ncbi:MAG: hypothetical protein P0Y65_14320 [Candidatus Devosia phytovorans]|uniref:Uncharacterized protein n=1 Tax=Candidatus Devosia phytovorans TaxID=3121372 RepID=A0AAJ5VTT0_9HYPH|nr:hypothetical protein [Devosia sp.]WEK03363.1 MAG: hypothetical protein P0Y65_14320 [Devosia sp.]
MSCWHLVRIRTWTGVSILAEIPDPVEALSFGKAEVRRLIAAGSGWDILAVEVVDLQGTLVLGEETEGFCDLTFAADRAVQH